MSNSNCSWTGSTIHKILWLWYAQFGDSMSDIYIWHRYVKI